MKSGKVFIFALIILALFGQQVFAEEVASQLPSDVQSDGNDVTRTMFTVNNVWMMVCTFLVFIMHLGFSCIESGLTRAKNTVNVLTKNVCIVAIGLLSYAVIGWGIMYPGSFEVIGDGILGFAGLGLNFTNDAAAQTSTYNAGYTAWTDFLFQGMFAATAATIVSGAVAERIKLMPFLVFSTIYVAICYPIVGSWTWGGGFLTDLGFKDFAGSSIVHGAGGWAALVCAFILGPRIGKYVDGKSKPIFGHSVPLANIGMFLLWLGWFGFNGGSVLSAAAGDTSRVLVTTSLAAAAGIIGSLLVSGIVQKKPDLTMLLNGSLAGLVGITASADVVSWKSSIIIGLVAGILVVVAVMFIDQKLRIDDPVGAISVHLVCGVWGTLAVALFGVTSDGGSFSLMVQLQGVLAIGAFCVITSGILFYLLKITVGVRVSKEEEVLGLDISEHGMEAYGGFQIFNNQ